MSTLKKRVNIVLVSDTARDDLLKALNTAHLGTLIKVTEQKGPLFTIEYQAKHEEKLFHLGRYYGQQETTNKPARASPTRNEEKEPPAKKSGKIDINKFLKNRTK